METFLWFLVAFSFPHQTGCYRDSGSAYYGDIIYNDTEECNIGVNLKCRDNKLYEIKNEKYNAIRIYENLGDFSGYVHFKCECEKIVKMGSKLTH